MNTMNDLERAYNMFRKLEDEMEYEDLAEAMAQVKALVFLFNLKLRF